MHSYETTDQVSISVSAVSVLAAVLAPDEVSSSRFWISDKSIAGSGALQYRNELYWQNSSSCFEKRQINKVNKTLMSIPAAENNKKKLFIWETETRKSYSAITY